MCFYGTNLFRSYGAWQVDLVLDSINISSLRDWKSAGFFWLIAF